MIGDRSGRAERMDGPDVDPAMLRRAMAELATLNRRLGGYRPLREALAELVIERKAVRVLDVGAGDAGTLLHLRRWAPPSWRFVGLDLHPAIARLARSRIGAVNRIAFTRSDALRMPFRDDAFHVAFCNLTLHHFGDREAVSLLREMARVASVRVVVNDLHRHVASYLAALVLAGTVWLNSPITRHDGPLSVRRSFTPDELMRLGTAAGLGEVRVRRRFPFRLLLDGRPCRNPRNRRKASSGRASRARSPTGPPERRP